MAFRQPASLRRLPPSPERSGLIRRASAKRRSERRGIELPASLATGSHTTRTARSLGIASTPTHVPLREDSPSTSPQCPKDSAARTSWEDTRRANTTTNCKRLWIEGLGTSASFSPRAVLFACRLLPRTTTSTHSHCEFWDFPEDGSGFWPLATVGTSNFVKNQG